MTQRMMNFSPGPAALPLQALEEARAELLDFQGTGISILEHSHRGKDYEAVHEEAKSLLRELLQIPSNYRILFMQGGAAAQFALVPMNFLHAGQSADYIMTGVWSEKALGEAKILGQTRIAADTKEEGSYRRVPRAEEIQIDPSAAYAHMTTNNTIYGTQFHYVPESGAVPLIADMSSDIAWKPFDVSKFGLIYAGAQKNLGPAGVTLVIVREDLLERVRSDIPKIFRYSTIAKEDSLQNTAPTFAIYMVRNVLKWLKGQGGLAAMETRNRNKAAMLYDAVDSMSDFYRCPVEKASRSTMNAVFRLPSEELEKRFVAEASARRMVNLKGHRSVGGIRVSLYNAIEPAWVESLVAFMKEFAQTQG